MGRVPPRWAHANGGLGGDAATLDIPTDGEKYPMPDYEQIADPHPGLDVAVETYGPLGADSMAHRRRTHLVPDRVYPGQMEERAIYPAVAACGVGVTVKSLSWGFAHAQGVPLCTDSACYPDAA